jgi:hypothetical protein
MEEKKRAVMKFYSEDLRKHIIAARQGGKGTQETAKREGSKRTVERDWQRFGETGRCVALRRGGRRISRLKPHLETLRGWIEE